MKLSDGEKLILMMLCDVYEQMKVKGEIDTRLVKAAILNGQTWGITAGMPGIFAEEVSEDVVDEADRIMTMWSRIESTYAGLSAAEKARINEEAHPVGDDLAFKGFDANNDPHYGVAQFYIEDLGRFSEFKGRYLNSHGSPPLEAQRRMLEEFRSMEYGSRGFGTDEIIRLLRARIHPEHR